jgi:hypothetical protein
VLSRSRSIRLFEIAASRLIAAFLHPSAFRPVSPLHDAIDQRRAENRHKAHIDQEPHPALREGTRGPMPGRRRASQPTAIPAGSSKLRGLSPMSTMASCASPVSRGESPCQAGELRDAKRAVIGDLQHEAAPIRNKRQFRRTRSRRINGARLAYRAWEE